MKKIVLIPACLFCIIILAGCGKPQTQPNKNMNKQLPPDVNVNKGSINQAVPQNDNQPPDQNITPEPKVTITALVSTQDKLTFCNGADMDSEGYKKTITKKLTTTMQEANPSLQERLKAAIIAASQAESLTDVTDMEKDFIKISGDTAYLKPVEGWAGVSIFLCAWKPLVEANIQQYPETKKIEWVNDPIQWGNL